MSSCLAIPDIARPFFSALMAAVLFIVRRFFA
jgi:hypothetical protein